MYGMQTRGLRPARQFDDTSELITQLPARIIACACALSQLVTQTSGDRACTVQGTSAGQYIFAHLVPA